MREKTSALRGLPLKFFVKCREKWLNVSINMCSWYFLKGEKIWSEKRSSKRTADSKNVSLIYESQTSLVQNVQWPPFCPISISVLDHGTYRGPSLRLVYKQLKWEKHLLKLQVSQKVEVSVPFTVHYSINRYYRHVTS